MKQAASADVLVVGAGLIGLASALAAQKEGFAVTVVDRAFEGDRASHGNAGGIAVTEHTPLSVQGMFWKSAKWLMDPLGPLSVSWKHLPKALPWFLAFNGVSNPVEYGRISRALAALNQRVFGDFLPMMKELGLEDKVYRRGAITAYETEAAFQGDQREWQFKRELGVNWSTLSAAELADLEPALARVFKRGVMLHDWSHIGDPKAIVQALRHLLVARGATLIEGEARAIDAALPDLPTLVLADGRRVAATRLVVAAGVWSKALANSVGDRVLLESERGYNTTLPHSGVTLSREIIFAERKFVVTPLDVGLRIGGAAEFAGTDAPPNYARSQALLTLGRRFVPGMDESGAVQWAGHRPATPDSLPVIGRSPGCPAVIYAFGHGHLGLTQSATTGALVADLLAQRHSSIDLQPYSIERFAR
jgi:D-amino-acid dehydrogenase